MTKVCIATVEGGFSVYQEDEASQAGAEGMEAAQGMAAPTDAPGGQDGQTVATVDEALQLAGQLLQGAASPAQDEASADALFQSGYNSAAKQR